LVFRLSTTSTDHTNQSQSTQTGRQDEQSEIGQNTIQDGKDLQIYAMEAQCPHLGADLSHAEIEEYEDELVAVCPWHRLVLLSL
jgi:nitrite reductase/ring-hydroxylating ferredoxin subunit